MIYASPERIGFVFRLQTGEFVAVLCQNLKGSEETAVFLCNKDGSEIDYSKALAVIKIVDVEYALNLLGHTKTLDKKQKTEIQ